MVDMGLQIALLGVSGAFMWILRVNNVDIFHTLLSYHGIRF
jgi:hypothetical protein